MRNALSKSFILLTIFVTLGWSLYWSYPKFRNWVQLQAVLSYAYHNQDGIVTSDVSNLPPAKAVPILMYHGVVTRWDGENTDQNHFVEQMEMLKAEGYTTISVAEFEQFLQGNLTLPPKPIVITFDDGRRDSYYPTDEIFEKLGFKATMFVVTGKTNAFDKFYLSWDELRKMQASGRWEIEAHGAQSHDRIMINESGEMGRFLSSRRYNPGGGLESEEDFRQRVTADYDTHIVDLYSQLGIDAAYYAIPLNDFGVRPISNYPESYDFNMQLVRERFRLAFIQANESVDVTKFARRVYNFKDVNRYSVVRIEVKNMDPEFLKEKLEDEYPWPAAMTLDAHDQKTFADEHELAYGEARFDTDGLHLYATEENDSAKVLFGDDHWDSYTVEAKLRRIHGRSIVLLGYVKDERNYVAMGLTDNGVFLRETIDGEEKDLVEIVLDPTLGNRTHVFKLMFSENSVSAYVDTVPYFLNIPVTGFRGQVGFKVWDDKNQAEGILESLKVTTEM